jgi:hypothetical protein
VKRKPATPPRLEREPWSLSIEPVDGMLPFGRYRITLTSGAMRYGGGDGWGWLAWTYAGARRKGERELLRKQRQERTLELRAEWMAGGPSIATMKHRLWELDARLQPGRGGVVFQSDVMERAALLAKLGPLVAQPEVPLVPLPAGPPRRPPRGGSGASDAR